MSTTTPQYHVNPETGRAGACNAVFRCRFGGVEVDHFSTKEEARASYEEKMKEQVLADNIRKPKQNKPGVPILREPSKLKTPDTDVKYDLEYDYNSWSSGCECGSICRCSTINDVEITGWAGNDPDGLATYARNQLNLPKNKPFPQDLQEKLKPYQDFRSIEDDFEVNIDRGYYGEEINSITAPEYLTRALKDHYYNQPDAVGPANILPYLRGKGFETTGRYPLEAIKESLRLENGGKLNRKVDSAKSFTVSSISLKNIKLPSKSQAAEGLKNPRKPEPVKGSGADKDIAGVVYKTASGEYELIDGYHRHGYYTSNTSRKKANYIVLSGERNDRSSVWWKNDNANWSQE